MPRQRKTSQSIKDRTRSEIEKQRNEQFLVLGARIKVAIEEREKALHLRIKELGKIRVI
jgi:hypothetical protein